MNWTLVVMIVGGALGLLGQWGIIAYYAGRETKAREGLTNRVDGHSTWIKEVAAKGNQHETRISVLEDWRDTLQHKRS